MNYEFILALISDGLFAAVAAIGFAVISNPPKKAVAASAFLAAIGHAFRYYLLHKTSLDIATSTFLASTLIGILSFGCAKAIHCPNEVFTFPSLLPMIPGMYAYKMFLSLTKFIRCDDPQAYPNLLIDIFKNGWTAIFILIALVVGVSLPVLLFHKQSFTMTRILRPIKNK